MKTRILVASDGSRAALGALRLARALAERWEVPAEVVAVVEPFPVYGMGSTELVTESRRQLELQTEVALHHRVQAQLAELDPAFVGWPITLAVGAPAPTIARLAHEKGASIILLGLGQHALPDRLLGSETALRVMRLAHVPVLAVPGDAAGLPRRAVVAVDFSDFSRDAVRTTLDLLAPGGELHLAHVLWRLPPETPWVGGEDWIEEYRASAPRRLAEFAGSFEGAAEVRTETHTLEGDPARAVLNLAGRVEADLIAAGSHGTGFFGRILMGSVSTRLVRGATCAVLIAPPRSTPAELARLTEDTRQSVQVAGEPSTGEPAGTPHPGER